MAASSRGPLGRTVLQQCQRASLQVKPAEPGSEAQWVEVTAARAKLSGGLRNPIGFPFRAREPGRPSLEIDLDCSSPSSGGNLANDEEGWELQAGNIWRAGRFLGDPRSTSLSPLVWECVENPPHPGWKDVVSSLPVLIFRLYVIILLPKIVRIL